MKILVVDDHALIRDALRGLFRELKPDATVLEAPDASQAMQLLADQPDIRQWMVRADKVVARKRRERAS